jgi:hypothetical protein
MFAANVYPIDTFRVFLFIFPRNRKELVVDPLFGFVLRAVVSTEDPEVMASIPAVISYARIPRNVLFELSRIGFIRRYIDCAIKADRVQDLFTVAEMLADIEYVDEFMIIMEISLREANTEMVLPALQVLAKLARYRKCGRKLGEIGFFEYCRELEKYPDLTALARGICDDIERAME